MEAKQTTSLRDNLADADDSIQNLLRNLREYKKLVELSKADIINMENQVSLDTDDTPRSISPQIEEMFGDLHQEIQNQKSKNEHIQKQLTELKKEKSIIQQKIIANNTRCQILETNIGLV